MVGMVSEHGVERLVFMQDEEDVLDPLRRFSSSRNDAGVDFGVHRDVIAQRLGGVERRRQVDLLNRSEDEIAVLE